MRLVKIVALFVLVGAGQIACGRKGVGLPDPDLARFVTNKRAQAKELADAQTNDVPATVWTFFDAVERNDWLIATNQFERLRVQSGRISQPTHPGEPSRLASTLQMLGQKLGLSDGTKPALNTELWSPLSETFGAYEQFHDWDLKWLRRFGRDVIDSIPSNSIYFGGTDAGHYVIAALSESHREGRPFFTLTQNQLRDASYLDYLRTMYGPKIYIPTSTDVQDAFQRYIEDAQVRVREGKLEPTELMPIEGLLVKVILEKNPGREFFLRESYRMKWTYPRLSPHGLVFKLHPEPLAELSESIVVADRDYWAHYVKELIGDWLTRKTSVTEVCDFGGRVFLRKDLTGFKGDSGFARNKAAQLEFSNLRSAIGVVYAWRAERAQSTAEKERMLREADLAFRQALALCPYSAETIFRYITLLLSQRRSAEARLIVQTWQKFDPSDPRPGDILKKLEKYDQVR